MSSATVLTCSTMNSPGTGWMPVTPTVLWAVSAVIAVIPCTPQRANAFRSAWMPAPPPESEPAIDRTAGTGLGTRVRVGYGRMAAGADDILAGYEAEQGTFDEGFDAAGRPHPWARPSLEAVLRTGPDELAARMRETLAHHGVTFQTAEGEEDWYVDPVPRVLTADDWTHVKRGLAQ